MLFTLPIVVKQFLTTEIIQSQIVKHCWPIDDFFNLTCMQINWQNQSINNYIKAANEIVYRILMYKSIGILRQKITLLWVLLMYKSTPLF